MILSTELYFTTITPLTVNGSTSRVEIDYETTVPDDYYDLTITDGEDYVYDIDVDKVNTKIIVYLVPYVFTESDTSRGTRNISFYLGNESYGDNCTITQVKSAPELSVSPESISVPYADENQSFTYELNSDDYDFTDITLTQPGIAGKVTFHVGGIDEQTGEIDKTILGTVYSDFIPYTQGSMVKTDIQKVLSTSGTIIAGYDNDDNFKGVYKKAPYLTDGVTTALFNTFAQDAVTYFSDSAGTFDGKIRLQCQDYGLDNTNVYYQKTPDDYILSTNIDATGTINLTTLPNFTHQDKSITLTVSLPSGENKQVTVVKDACEDEYLTPFVENKVAHLNSLVNNYAPQIVDSFQVYCPDEWEIIAINGSYNIFDVEIDNDNKTVNLLQSRGNVAPSPGSRYRITIQCKPTIADDNEYLAHTFTRFAEATYFIDEALDTTQINVDYTGKKSNVITINNVLKVENITDYQITNLNGITLDKIIVALNANSGSLSIRKLTENTSLVNKIMSFDFTLIWGSTATNTYHITIVQDKNTTFEEIPISKDTYYTLQDNDVYYRLLDVKTDNVLYSGKVYPSVTKTIKINDIIKDYLQINKNPFNSVFVNNNEYINVLLQTSSDNTGWNNIIKYYFYYDYSYNEAQNTTAIGLNSIPYQVVNKYSPYQYFITTRQFANAFNTYYNVNINLKETESYGGQTKTINIPESRGEVISCVLSGDVYESISIVSGAHRPYHVDYYEQSCIDSDWVLYYINEIGGWNWMFFDGKNIESNTIKRNSYFKDNKYTVSYKNDVTQSWDLTTKYLDDVQSKQLMQLYKSPIVYMQKLDYDTTPFLVNVDTNTYQVKTRINQGKKRFTHNIKVSNAKTNEWLA